MGSDDQVRIVGEIYEAFGRGDVPAILEHVAPDVAWESWADNHAQRAGVPWLQAHSDHVGVTEFFGVVGGMDVTRFEVLNLLAGGGAVAAEIEIDTARFKDQEMHLWTFGADDKVVRFRHYTDTAKHIAAADGA
jgi:ketosteroid isomerase-like protein